MNDDIRKLECLDLIDTNSIESIIVLTNNNTDLFDNILKSFIEDVVELIATAEKASKENNFLDIKYSIHSIKGLASTLGTKRVAEIAKLIDSKIKEGLLEESKEYIPNLAESIKLTIKELNKK
ncbi:MAG: hypothetical protein A2X12_02155 [Bacteroidetes bacterium GWE2_29_8]|nr:MAG: hypothetical protein A2X12_02155 [Bacteroidetes bacterium GWE2_29_8]